MGGHFLVVSVFEFLFYSIVYRSQNGTKGVYGHVKKKKHSSLLYY